MNFPKIFVVALIMMTLFSFSSTANALQYQTCFSAQQSPVCLIAFEKLQTLQNPITKQRFFHNGVNITQDNKLFLYPMLYVATPDIDKDGNPEIIVGIPESTQEVEGEFCLPPNQCPHYIIQDRSLPDQKRSVSTYKAIGPIYASSIALSTNEVIDNFKSLRAYYTPTWEKFDVFQYDKDTDTYYNMSAGP